MMGKRFLLGFLTLAMTSHAALADAVAGDALRLLGQAQYCYAGLFPVYEASYYRIADSEDEAAEGRCIHLSYKREITAEALAKATWKTFEEQHGPAVTRRHREGLQRIGESYLDVDVDRGYTYCLTERGQGVLYHANSEILTVSDQELAQRYLQLWVREERAGEPLWTFRDCS